MNAMDALLAGLFDYAGLYPPASLSMRSAANNYLEYSRRAHATALGRFIVNFDRLDELRSIAGDSFRRFRLSAIVAENSDWERLAAEIREGAPIDTVEIKCSAADMERIARQIPPEVTAFFEVGMDDAGRDALKVISGAGAHAKIRMGGVVAEAFPASSAVLRMLQAMAELRLSFKATAGLHHPVRSRRPLTYQPQSPQGTMHGFVNLGCAAALIYFGGEGSEAEELLEEQDASAWRVTTDAIRWRDRSWTAGQIAEVRSKFLLSIGSCSFEEPIHDLESLRWL